MSKKARLSLETEPQNQESASLSKNARRALKKQRLADNTLLPTDEESTPILETVETEHETLEPDPELMVMHSVAAPFNSNKVQIRISGPPEFKLTQLTADELDTLRIKIMESEQSENSKKINPKDAMSKGLWTTLEDKFSRANLLDDEVHTNLENFFHYKREDFFKHAIRLCAHTPGGKPPKEFAMDMQFYFAVLPDDALPERFNIYMEKFKELSEMVDADTSVSRTVLKDLIEILVNNMPKFYSNKASLAIHASIKEHKGKIIDLTQLRRKINEALKNSSAIAEMFSTLEICSTPLGSQK